MAFEANLAPGAERYRMRTAEERALAFRKAAQHSRYVGILRKALPVLAVAVLAAYFISSQFSVSVGDLTASISGIEVADGNLRMTNPKLKGTDKKNGAYVVSAEYADQDIKNPKIVKLHALKAELSTGSDGWSLMQAARGVFDSQSERLVMQDKITVATSSGVSGTLKHASLDMKTQTLRSHRPVAFDLPNGTVNANALTFRSSDSTLTFRGKVRVRLVRKAKDEDAAAKPRAAQQSPQAVLPEATGTALPDLPPLPQPVGSQ